MAALRNKEALDELRQKIAGLENRPAFAESPAPAAGTFSALLTAAPGLLTEIFAPERRAAGAALGFALGQARALLSSARPALIVLQLAPQAQEIGVPYGAGLVHLGFDPAAIVLGRIENVPDLLWAIEEAVCCRAVAAVIVDVAGHPKALDFTASRRLSLRAAASGTSIFFLRYGRDREASAAQLRWGLEPLLSIETPFDARAPAGPRFFATLEKGRIGAARLSADGGLTLTLDWTQNGFVVASDGRAAGLDPAAAPASGTAPAALGDRLSQAG
jgi:protein ImuA